MVLSSPRLLALIWFMGLVSAARLPTEELRSLAVVARTLGKTDWSFDGDDVDPCNGQPPWRIEPKQKEIVCNCSYQNDTVCHVTHLYLKSENLSGSLPRELMELPLLQVIDLTRNYLNGTIPPQWGSTKLATIALLGNLLTGPIPRELANITTLEELVLEDNQFTEAIPSELGNFTRIRRLLLSSNNLTGELPATLAKLTNLTDFRISDNNFTGSIPIYIQDWTKVTRMEIQGSGLTGPIPSNLTSLTELTDLRISDLNGENRSRFPNLYNRPSWDNVILRSCNIDGGLPESISNMKINTSLDLSFNNLTGPIPQSFGVLTTDNIILSGNSLNGRVPNEVMEKGQVFDLSYNNFTTDARSDECRGSDPNLFANAKENTPDTFYCARSTCKPNEYYYLHINCGGPQEGVHKADYQSGPSYEESNSNWGFRRTGVFLNTEDYGEKYIAESESSISGADNPELYKNNPELYKNARLSPVSLTYYGICLRNGRYTVNLHFAEIMFINRTQSDYGAPGRRLFHIYIQGILVKKDFNIAIAAGGVFKAHTEKFPANVSNHTLEIRFYWAGKGTNAIPGRTVHGPLISAISVVHDTYRPRNISAGAIVGIVIAALSAVALVLCILWWKGCIGRKNSMYRDLRGLDLHAGSFTLRQLRAATNNFDPANKIGEGGFGPVFKGVLLDGQVIAVKQLSSKSKQGNREFINEIGMISALQHPHLVKLYGCCIEGNQLLLVYEYCENNSLARALFGPEAYQLDLDWPTRHAICIGIARGLAYLHEESRLKIVHRDIKTTNVLLDGNLVPKISDFGLAKLDEEDNTHISTRIAGTFGYMAPEYAMHGYLTDKADVYSFGVVLLEIVSGRSNSSIRPKEQNFYLIDWANSLKAKGNLLELVDPRLEMKLKKEEVIRTINVALLCTNAEAVERPSMSTVVSMLEGSLGVGRLDSKSSISTDKTKPEEIEMRDGERHSVSVDGPWTGSSASASDLYPVAFNTSYWEKRGL